MIFGTTSTGFQRSKLQCLSTMVRRLQSITMWFDSRKGMPRRGTQRLGVTMALIVHEDQMESTENG